MDREGQDRCNAFELMPDTLEVGSGDNEIRLQPLQQLEIHFPRRAEIDHVRRQSRLDGPDIPVRDLGDSGEIRPDRDQGLGKAMIRRDKSRLVVRCTGMEGRERSCQGEAGEGAAGDRPGFTGHS